MAKQKQQTFSGIFGRNVRSEKSIFVDLSQLCRQPGFVHAIAFVCIRDNVIAYRRNIRPDDMLHLHNPKRLIRTEVNVLIGLLVKGEIDFTLPNAETLEAMVTKAESLLGELHQAMMKDAWDLWTPQKMKDKNFNPLKEGKSLRENIFYGGESAYYFQYRDFIVPKYSADDDWLRKNHGFSTSDCHQVIRAVGRVRNANANEFVNRVAPATSGNHSFLPASEFSAAEVAQRIKLPQEIVNRVLEAFTLPAGAQNAAYNTVQDYNIVSARPLIRHGENYLLFDIYNLVESAYQSPYYWMGADKDYVDTAMANRGKYTEHFAAHRLIAVFGEKNVRVGVNIMSGKIVVGEIDVLVTFGDRLIILQAKSKQLTLAARRGDDKQLQDDFQKAIQSACNQGGDCAKHLLAGGVTLEMVDGTAVDIPEKIEKIYLICAIADHYPGLSFQASQFLKYEKQSKVSPPFVMDVFHLDAMAEMLDTPLYFLSYVDRRTGYSDNFSSNFELTILGYHLSHNLWKEKKADLIMLTDDNALALDTSMLVRRDGITGPWTPDGILTRLRDTSLGTILKQIEKTPNPAMLEFGFYLLTMDEGTFKEVSTVIDSQCAKARQDKGVHDFSLMLEDKEAGLTMYFGYESLDVAIEKLMAHCAMRKYVQRAGKWFGLIVNPGNGLIEYGACIETKWAKDPVLDELTKNMAPAPKIERKVIRKLAAVSVGRNDPCTCGSGKKYKKCCLLAA